MYRLFLVLAAVAAFAAWTAGPVLAQAGGDYQLPPVKLKPDRPTTAKPIPPTPDDRMPAPPAENPPEPTPPPTPPAPPVEKPPEAPPTPPAPPPMPPMPPVEKPPATPPMPPMPPVEKLPAMPPTPPAPPPMPPAPPVEKPAPKLTPKSPAPIETPVEKPPELPPLTPAKTPAKAPVKEATPVVETPVEPAPIAKPLKTSPMAEAALPPLPPMPPDLAREHAAASGATPKAGKPGDVQKDMMEAQVRPALREVDLSGVGEVGLAEEVARARKAYARALTAIKDHYLARATAVKLEWVTAELDALDRVPKIQYLTVAEMAGPNLRPIRRIEAADQLYEEGTQYKNYPAMPFPMSNPGKDTYLKKALEKFQTIIEKYPESDKIDDAAFRMGEIYGGWYFNDFARAVECYQRCWEWNPKTDLPAIFNAAKLYEEKLNNRAKAVELYNRVLAESANEELQKQAVDRIKALTGK